MRMDKLTSKFQLALADAQSLAVGLDHQLIEPEHVMVALLDQEGGSMRHLLTKAGARVNALRSQLGERLDAMPKVSGAAGEVNLSNDTIKMLTITDKLAQNIAGTFAEGHETVLLENHGIVTGGHDLLAAFARLETVDFCARTLLQAGRLGEVNPLTDAQLAAADIDPQLPDFPPCAPGSRERELRRQIVDMVHRAYLRKLMTGTQGAVSARLEAQDFLITPAGTDRHLLDISDIVLVQHGKRESGKQPSRATRLHAAIYRQHPGVNYIMTAQSPNIMAYAVTSAPLNTRTLFESHYLLRDIPVLPFGEQYQQSGLVANAVSASTPVVLIQNDCLVVTGQTILQAFDRLEVAESIAEVLIDTDSIGGFVTLTDAQIQEVDVAFSL